MVAVADFVHLLKSIDVADVLDEIASADPPAYLRRCFAEGVSAPYLSWSRIQQLAVCAMVIDAVVNARDYGGFEPELMADWRLHDKTAFARLAGPAVQALQRARLHDSAVADPAAADPPHKPDVAAELEDLQHRLGSA
jgi:hypothetical protein